MAAHLELGSKELQRFAAPQDCIDNPWTLKFRFQEGSVKVTCWETLKRHNKQRGTPPTGSFTAFRGLALSIQDICRLKGGMQN